MNRVWIELDNNGDAVENEVRAALVNQMIAKLHHNDEDRKLQMTFQWSPHHDRYISMHGPSGSFKILDDNGEWFNLDYLAQ
jgi:hypothetical protein